jgi:hypothetical protein
LEWGIDVKGESMSANNGIFINLNNFKVYEHGCMDNNFIEEEAFFIGEGKDLEDAVKLAMDYQQTNEVEYGIHFYKEKI